MQGFFRAETTEYLPDSRELRHGIQTAEAGNKILLPK